MTSSNELHSMYQTAVLLSKQEDGCEAAMALYRRALAVDPDHVDSLYNLANMLSVDSAQRHEAVALMLLWWALCIRQCASISSL